MKKKIYTFLILMLAMGFAHGQQRKNHFPIWSFHQKNVNINGLSVGAWSGYDNRNTNTNGMKLEALGEGFALMLLPKDPLESDNFRKDSLSERINGVSISGSGTICNCRINGIGLGTFGQLVTQVNGLSAVVFNIAFEHNGVQLGAISAVDKIRGVQLGIFSSSANDVKGLQMGTINTIKKGSGLQIGLFNTADNFRGLQLGFYNKNQKRTMPFINWNFSD